MFRVQNKETGITPSQEFNIMQSRGLLVGYMATNKLFTTFAAGKVVVTNNI